MSPLVIVVLIVLVDLMGFTIVMPLLPRFSSDYGFTGTQIGLIMAAYPFMQLLSAPILGWLSDRHGRRPILIVSQFGTSISFVILALTQDFRLMLLARLLDGASGGNILVAQAYIADVTTPENRTRGLGMLGAAFGMGFVLGPILAGALLTLPWPDGWATRVPFLVAAGFSTAAWILVLLKLPESLSAQERGHAARARTFTIEGLTQAIRRPQAGVLILVGSLITLAFSALEGTFALFLEKRFHWDAPTAAFTFGFLGVLSAVIQGGLIRPMVRSFGEARLILTGATILALGFFALASATAVTWLLVAMTMIAIGYGLAVPTVSGLLSRSTPPVEQGTLFGVYASAQTFARMANYLVANRLLSARGPSAPFWEAAIITVAALMLALAAGVWRFSPRGDGDSETRWREETSTHPGARGPDAGIEDSGANDARAISTASALK